MLPMAMRGLPVPGTKRRYIAFDAAREARLRGVPFGRIADPLGEPTRRGLALMPLAERTGHGPDYLLSFMRGVWAEGIDAGSGAAPQTMRITCSATIARPKVNSKPRIGSAE